MYTRILTVAALIFYSNLVPADQTDDRLETLFITLSSSSDKQVIRSTENQIWDIWFAHPNSDVERLMQIGVQRMNANRQSEAMIIFSQLVVNFPDYAEAWNRRATLHTFWAIIRNRLTTSKEFYLLSHGILVLFPDLV